MIKATYLNLKDYDKLNRLSKGSFGDLFLLKNKKSGEIYAGKLLINSVSGDEIARELAQKISIISKINHPSIIRFIGISQNDFENKRNPVIVSEYLPNGSLDQIINLAIHGNAPEKWDDTQKLITLYGIASGMAFLHSHNILHCDLKPSNILLDEYLNPKISDIGLSKEKKSQIQSKIIPKGSPLYMAPEIFESCNYSKASDVYAFGIITYQIICDEKPITFSENTKKLMMRVLDGKRYSLDFPIGKSYRKLIKNCWNQNKEKRLSFEQIKEELKTDPGFIIETVDEKRFLKYVEYIDNQKAPYDDNTTNEIFNTFGKLKKNNNTDDDNEEIDLDDFPIKIYKKLDKKDKELVIKAIKENDSNAQYCLAINFFHRINKFPKNSQLGIKYLKMAVDNGNTSALKNYSRKIIDGDLISENPDKVREMLIPHIDDIDPEIFLLYGLVCYQEKDFKQAEKYLEKAVSKGNSEAMYELGLFYFNQLNIEKANEFFDMAKNNGYRKLPPSLDNQNKDQNSSTQPIQSKKQFVKKTSKKNRFASTSLYKPKSKSYGKKKAVKKTKQSKV